MPSRMKWQFNVFMKCLPQSQSDSIPSPGSMQGSYCNAIPPVFVHISGMNIRFLPLAICLAGMAIAQTSDTSVKHDVGSGAGDIGKGAAKGAGSAAKATGNAA